MEMAAEFTNGKMTNDAKKLFAIFFVFITCIYFSKYSTAQVFSAPAKLSLDSINGSFSFKPKIDFRIDTRNSFITNTYAQITGIKVGLDFNKTVKIGLGYNWLSSGIFFEKNEGRGRLMFRYFSPYFEYAFYKNKRWEFSIPLMIGIGKAGYKFENDKLNTKFIFLYEPYMICQYKILSWFGVGFGVGYRLCYSEIKNSEKFNSPIYVLKAKLFPGDLLKKFIPKGNKRD